MCDISAGFCVIMMVNATYGTGTYLPSNDSCRRMTITLRKLHNECIDVI
jgi:hypothetical protein